MLHCSAELHAAPRTRIADILRTLGGQISAAAATADRSEQSVTLVAVSKGQDASTIRAAAELGIKDFGESYLQEALSKRAALSDLALSWHFIGRIQANKTRPLAQDFDWVHGIDRLKIAERLSAQRPAAKGAAWHVFLQINIAAEANKAGIALAETAAPAARWRARRGCGVCRVQMRAFCRRGLRRPTRAACSPPCALCCSN